MSSPGKWAGKSRWSPTQSLVRHLTAKLLHYSNIPSPQRATPTSCGAFTNPLHSFSLTPCIAGSAHALLGSHLIHTRCIPVHLPPQSPFFGLAILKTMLGSHQVFNLHAQSLPSWTETVMEGYGAWDAACNQECCRGC